MVLHVHRVVFTQTLNLRFLIAGFWQEEEQRGALFGGIFKRNV